MADTKTIIENYLKEGDWEFKFDEKNTSLTLDFQAEHCFLSVYVFFSEKHIGIVSWLPFTVGEEKLHEMGELLHRINNDLVNGCFVLDYDEEMINFQTGIAFVNLELTKELFENLYMTNVVAADEHAKMIMALLSSDASPQKVYEDAQALEEISKE